MNYISARHGAVVSRGAELLGGVIGVLVCMLMLPVVGRAGDVLSRVRLKGTDLSYELGVATDVVIEAAPGAGGDAVVVFAGEQEPGRYACDLAMVTGMAGVRGATVKAGLQVEHDTSFGGAGLVQFTNPCAVVIGPAGDLYALDRIDAWNNRIHRLRATGEPVPRFGENGALSLRRTQQWIAVGADGRLYLHNSKGAVEAFDSAGKSLCQVGNHRSSVGGVVDGTGRIFLRAGKRVHLLDPCGPGGTQSDSPAVQHEPFPVNASALHGRAVGPSMVAGRGGALFLNDQHSTGNYFGAVVRYQIRGNALERCYHSPQRFKDCLGMATDRQGMLYVTERGTDDGGSTSKYWEKAGRGGVTASRVYLLWDSGETLNRLCFFEFPKVKGLRDVAAAADGSALYLLEDADNFAYWGKTKKYLSRDVRGRGRLFKYRLSYREIRAADMTRQ